METNYSNQKQLLYNNSKQDFIPYFSKQHQQNSINLSNESLSKTDLLTNLTDYILDNYINEVCANNTIISNLSTVYGFYDIDLTYNSSKNLVLTLDDPQICVIIDDKIITCNGEYTYTDTSIGLDDWSGENKYIMYYAQYYNQEFTINLSIYDSVTQTIIAGDTPRLGYFIPFVFVNGQELYNNNNYNHHDNQYISEKLPLPNSIYDGYLLSKNLNILDGGGI